MEKKNYTKNKFILTHRVPKGPHETKDTIPTNKEIQASGILHGQGHSTMKKYA